MGKKLDQKYSQDSEEEQEEDYDSEQDEDMSEDDDQYEDGDDQEREIDREHILNYESDDSDIEGMHDDSDDDSLDLGLAKQKQELTANNTWGQNKKSFYGRDKKAGDDVTSSEDDEDERLEALRLQKLRAQKLQLLAKEKVQQKTAVEVEKEIESVDESDDSDDSVLLKKGKKLGDKLFADENQDNSEINANSQSLKQLLKHLNDNKMAKKLIAQDSPELQGLLEEFKNTIDSINEIRPVLQSADKQLRQKHKNAFNYLEMRHNLMLSYCTFVSFYLLLKLEGKPVKEHPVIFKLANIKTLLDGLSEIDQKVESQVKRLIKQTQKKQKKSIKQQLVSNKDTEVKKSKKKNLSDEEDALSYDDELDEKDYDDEYDMEDDGDEEMEDEMMIDDDQDLPSESDIKKAKNQQLKQTLKSLDQVDDIKALIKTQSKDKNKEKETKKPKKHIDELSDNDDMITEKKSKDKKKNKDKNRDKEDGQEKQERRKVNFNDLQVSGEIEGDEVYQQQKDKMVLKKKLKQQKKQEVKEQQLQEVERMEKDIQRNINYDIMKAKGLTRKRKKIYRNSRVKFREKYRKALIKRGSKVQEFKAGPKGVYGGEASGLKAGIIKSTALS